MVINPSDYGDWTQSQDYKNYSSKWGDWSYANKGYGNYNPNQQAFQKILGSQDRYSGSYVPDMNGNLNYVQGELVKGSPNVYNLSGYNSFLSPDGQQVILGKDKDTGAFSYMFGTDFTNPMQLTAGQPTGMAWLDEYLNYSNDTKAFSDAYTQYQKTGQMGVYSPEEQAQATAQAEASAQQAAEISARTAAERESFARRQAVGDSNLTVDDFYKFYYGDTQSNVLGQEAKGQAQEFKRVSENNDAFANQVITNTTFNPGGSFSNPYAMYNPTTNTQMSTVQSPFIEQSPQQYMQQMVSPIKKMYSQMVQFYKQFYGNK